MSDIFLSYSKDDLARAKELATVFEAQNWSVFWDQKIPPGTSFARFIQEKIDASACVVVLWTHTSVLSEWVEIEAAWGKNTTN